MVRVLASIDALRDRQPYRPIAMSRLARSPRWSPYLVAADADAEHRTLGTIARVHRGQVTGANDFFVMTRARAQELGITRWCRPADAALDAYLRTGERGSDPICMRYVCAHRKPWWCVKPPRPPIVASYMARQPPAFALNPDRLALLNIGHAIFRGGPWNRPN